MRNNENIDDLPVYVLVLACEIPNFTKSLFSALKIDQRAVKTCVWHVLRVSNGKNPGNPLLNENSIYHAMYASTLTIFVVNGGKNNVMTHFGVICYFSE